MAKKPDRPIVPAPVEHVETKPEPGAPVEGANGVIPEKPRPGPKPAACPQCDADVSTAPAVGGLLACPVCARTLVLEDGSARLATDADVSGLTESQRVQLKAQRPKAWRENVKARVAAIRGKAR